MVKETYETLRNLWKKALCDRDLDKGSGIFGIHEIIIFYFYVVVRYSLGCCSILLLAFLSKSECLCFAPREYLFYFSHRESLFLPGLTLQCCCCSY